MRWSRRGPVFGHHRREEAGLRVATVELPASRTGDIDEGAVEDLVTSFVQVEALEQELPQHPPGLGDSVGEDRLMISPEVCTHVAQGKESDPDDRRMARTVNEFVPARRLETAAKRDGSRGGERPLGSRHDHAGAHLCGTDAQRGALLVGVGGRVGREGEPRHSRGAWSGLTDRAFLDRNVDPEVGAQPSRFYVGYRRSDADQAGRNVPLPAGQRNRPSLLEEKPVTGGWWRIRSAGLSADTERKLGGSAIRHGHQRPSVPMASRTEDDDVPRESDLPIRIRRHQCEIGDASGSRIALIDGVRGRGSDPLVCTVAKQFDAVRFQYLEHQLILRFGSSSVMFTAAWTREVTRTTLPRCDQTEPCAREN
jgi:hypothetical protein